MNWYKTAKLEPVSYQEIFDNALKKNNENKIEAAKYLLDVLTDGTWAVWDQEKIDKGIETILKKFDKTI